MVKADNPAGRLYQILDMAKGKEPNKLCRVVWAELFGISSDDVFNLFYYLRQIQQLSQASKELLNQIDGLNIELYMQGFPLIDQILFSTNLDRSWEIWKNILTSGVALTNLAYCSDAISMKFGEKLIEVEELNTLISEIESLRMSIISGNFDPELTELIIELLIAIRKAIKEYQFRGAYGIRDAVAKCFGTWFINVHRFDKEATNSQEKASILKNIWEFLVRVNVMIALALNLPKLALPIYETVALPIYQKVIALLPNN